MHFRVLGPLEVIGPDGDPVDLGGPKPRAVLTLLLLDANRVVSLDRIIDQMWGDEPPASATGNLQTYVSRLRRVLEPGRGPRQPAEVLLTRPPGYLLRADENTLDLLLFQRLVEDGEAAMAAGDPAAADATLRQALALWRGEPLGDLADEPTVAADRLRLHELYLRARLLYAETLLALGHAERAVSLLERIVAEHPLRERPWARLVEALYAAGRQADALDAARTCARTLREELGLEPGPELRGAEQSVLQQLPTLLPRPRPAAEAGHPLPPQAPLPVPASAPVAEPDPLRLVGRRTERTRLRHALDLAAAGQGQVVALEGEAGIGKTTLAEEAAREASGRGWQVAWSRCADDAGAPALWPWTQLVRQLQGDGDVELSAELSSDAGRDPDQQRFRLFQHLRGRLAALAADRPVLVVLDDVQAADATSLQLLLLLARHMDDVRLLVVATVRTTGERLGDDVRDLLAGLSRERAATRLPLSGLGEGDVRDLLAARLDAAPDRPLAREVHDRTDGNPFFVVELAQLLRSEHGQASAGASIPASVRDVLDRRLARLPRETLDLLRLAAVVGRDFSLDVLEAAAELDGEQVITRLEPAVITGTVTEEGQTWTWRFSHALVQETLAAGLSAPQRARLHHRVARVLEARGASGSRVDVDRLAHHYLQAVPVAGPQPALSYAVAAAEVARQRLAHDEAAVHTRRALALLASAASGDLDRRHDLLVALGHDLLRSGHLQEAQEVIGEALDVARSLGDGERLAEAASVWGGVTLWNWRPYGVVDHDLVTLLEDLAAGARDHDPALQARLLGTLGVELAYAPRRSDGIAYAEQGVDLSRRLGDPVLLGQTLNNYSLVTWGSEDGVARRTAAADEALALAGHGLPARTEFFARLHRGPLRLHLGDAAGFAADLAAATRLAEGLTGPEVRPHLVYQETGRAMLVGDWERAEDLATEANDLYRRTSMWGAQCCWALHQYTFRRQEGRLGEVLDVLVDTADMGIPLVQVLAVLAAATAGDTAEARRLQRRWQPARPQDWTTDSLIVAEAELALALDGDAAGAYASLLPFRGRQVVVGTATSCWGSYDEVLGRLALRLGRAEAAEEHLRDAVRLGADVGSPWQVQTAQRLLPSPDGTRSGRLSASQRPVRGGT